MADNTSHQFAVHRKFVRRPGLAGVADEIVAVLFCGLIGFIYYLFIPFVVYALYQTIANFSIPWGTALAVSFSLSFVPLRRSSAMVESYVFRCVARYFETELLQVETDDAIRNNSTGKHALCLAWHHGVIPFAAISSGPCLISHFGPTAVADVVLRIPVLRSIFAWYGSIPSSRRSIKATLQKENCLLYPGGIAELFLTDADVEKVYFQKRTGCIKLAIEAGADIIPIYFIGNTCCLSLLKSKFVSFISRKLKLSICLFWGRWGLPIPRPTKFVLVVGKRVVMPKAEHPSQEVVAEMHQRVTEACTETFNLGKRFSEEYKDKELVIK